MIFEALLVSLTVDNAPQLFDWAETLTEAYFRQQTVFAHQNEDQAYTTELLEKLQARVNSEFA